MEDLQILSLILGFIGCLFLVMSFVFQLYNIYKTKTAKGTTWGLIVSQLITCFLLSCSAGINLYVDGILNLPFLAANSSLFLLFIVMSYLKLKYDKI